MKIKVCGMRDTTNIMAVAGLSPDFMGFIFYRNSPRFVGDDFKIPALPQTVKRVGVFVNATTEEIVEKVRLHELDFIQLHGEETAEQCLELKTTDVGVIKVFSVDPEFDFENVRLYKDSADYFLFDTKGKSYGGNGVSFDWSILKKYDLTTPYFLSGGLTPDNITGAIALALPMMAGVDVNSGVEMSVGIKDIDKIKRFQAKVAN